MSPANSSDKPGGPYRKPEADIYTVLLALALVALLLGILVLYLENVLYEWELKGGPMISAGPPVPMAMVNQQRRVVSGQWIEGVDPRPLTTIH